MLTSFQAILACKLFNGNAFRYYENVRNISHKRSIHILVYLNEDHQLFGVNIDGERVKFENFVPIATLANEEPQVFVTKLEKTIADFIIKVSYTNF